jgi:hypothetical protein
MLDLYKYKFEDLSKHMFNLIVEKASTSRIPDFGDVEFEDAEVESFEENLIFTINGFSNSFHTGSSSHPITFVLISGRTTALLKSYRGQIWISTKYSYPPPRLDSPVSTARHESVMK